MALEFLAFRVRLRLLWEADLDNQPDTDEFHRVLFRFMIGLWG